ncbi:uncharacterized protein LOC114459264 [Scomber scombrus]|uniref:Uncharacterized protein LOC114459264 n=1 Tax=Scomber scombrus TaxID=13677 RepID=A0AAV1P447_SCOSC
MRVCSLHFHSGKPSYEMLENHPDWTPSLRLGHSDVKTTDAARYQRQVKHRSTQRQEQVPPLAEHQEEQPPSPAQDQRPSSPAQDLECGLCTSRQDVINSLLEENRKLKEEAQDQRPPSLAQDVECGLCTSRRDVVNSLLEENRKLKEELDEYRMNENFLSGDDNTVKYYTGLPNYVMFQTLLCSLTPYLPQGRMKKLSTFQLVLLTLMRLRLDLPVQHLSRLFRVHRTTVSDAFQHTL